MCQDPAACEADTVSGSEPACRTCAALSAPACDGARIGPNSIIRVADALLARHGAELAAAVFRDAGLSHHLETSPDSMVPAGDVTALHRALRAAVDRDAVEQVCQDAGVATADYLLAHRIPRPAQALLKIMPPVPAARVLIKAMGRHAWTFAGGGRFEGRAGQPTVLIIADGPIQAASPGAGAPVCGYYAATFQHLFRTLVSRRACVRETACQATGATACVFTVTWGRKATSESSVTNETGESG